MIDILIIRFGAEEAEGASGIAALGFDPRAFIIQLITFLLVFYILKRFVFGRIVDMLDKRREVIEQGMSLTTEMVAQKDKFDAEVAKTLKKAREEADEVLARTQVQATALIKEAEENAKDKVDNMLAEGRSKIEEETVKARRNLEKEVINLIVDATEIVVSEKIDPKKDAALLTQALKGKV